MESAFASSIGTEKGFMEVSIRGFVRLFKELERFYNNVIFCVVFGISKSFVGLSILWGP